MPGYLIIQTLKAIRSPIKKTRLWATAKLRGLIKSGRERAKKTGELGEYRAWMSFGEEVARQNLVPVFPENVMGLVGPEDLFVPHSELAMSTLTAGKALMAWAFTKNNAYAVVIMGPEEFTYLHGGLFEVLTPNLVRKTEFAMSHPQPLGVTEALVAGAAAGTMAGAASAVVGERLRKRREAKTTGDLGPGVRFRYEDIREVTRGHPVYLKDGRMFERGELNAAERAMVDKWYFAHGGLGDGNPGKHPAVTRLETAVSAGWPRDVSAGFLADDIMDVDDTRVYLDGGLSLLIGELNRRELEEVVKVVSR